MASAETTVCEFVLIDDMSGVEKVFVLNCGAFRLLVILNVLLKVVLFTAAGERADGTLSV